MRTESNSLLAAAAGAPGGVVPGVVADTPTCQLVRALREELLAPFCDMSDARRQMPDSVAALIELAKGQGGREPLAEAPGGPPAVERLKYVWSTRRSRMRGPLRWRGLGLLTLMLAAGVASQVDPEPLRRRVDGLAAAAARKASKTGDHSSYELAWSVLRAPQEKQSGAGQASYRLGFAIGYDALLRESYAKVNDSAARLAVVAAAVAATPNDDLQTLRYWQLRLEEIEGWERDGRANRVRQEVLARYAKAIAEEDPELAVQLHERSQAAAQAAGRPWRLRGRNWTVTEPELRSAIDGVAASAPAKLTRTQRTGYDAAVSSARAQLDTRLLSPVLELAPAVKP
jgi:hypothetical protein